MNPITNTSEDIIIQSEFETRKHMDILSSEPTVNITDISSLKNGIYYGEKEIIKLIH